MLKHWGNLPAPYTVTTRKEAVEVGRQLVKEGLIEHVLNQHNFEDKTLYYHFKYGHVGMSQANREMEGLAEDGADIMARISSLYPTFEDVFPVCYNMAHSKKGVQVKDRRYHLRLYKNCFVGRYTLLRPIMQTLVFLDCSPSFPLLRHSPSFSLLHYQTSVSLLTHTVQCPSNLIDLIISLVGLSLASLVGLSLASLVGLSLASLVDLSLASFVGLSLASLVDLSLQYQWSRFSAVRLWTFLLPRCVGCVGTVSWPLRSGSSLFAMAS